MKGMVPLVVVVPVGLHLLEKLGFIVGEGRGGKGGEDRAAKAVIVSMLRTHAERLAGHDAALQLESCRHIRNILSDGTVMLALGGGG